MVEKLNVKQSAYIALSIALSPILFGIVYYYADKPVPSWFIITALMTFLILIITFIICEKLYQNEKLKTRIFLKVIIEAVWTAVFYFSVVLGLCSETSKNDIGNYDSLPQIMLDSFVYIVLSAIVILLLVLIYFYIEQITKNRTIIGVISIILFLILYFIYLGQLSNFWIYRYGYFENMFPTEGRRNYSTVLGITFSSIMFMVTVSEIKVKNKTLKEWALTFLEWFLGIVSNNNKYHNVFKKIIKYTVIALIITTAGVFIYSSVTWGIDRVKLNHHKIYEFNSTDFFLFTESNLEGNEKLPDIVKMEYMSSDKKLRLSQDFLKRQYELGNIVNYQELRFDISDEMTLIIDLANRADIEVLKEKENLLSNNKSYSFAMHGNEDYTLFIKRGILNYKLYLYSNDEKDEIERAFYHVFKLNNIKASDKDIFVECYSLQVLSLISYTENKNSEIIDFADRYSLDIKHFKKILKSFKNPFALSQVIINRYEDNILKGRKEVIIKKSQGIAMQIVKTTDGGIRSEDFTILETIDAENNIFDFIIHSKWDADYLN